MTKEWFLKIAKEKHNDKYNYENIEFIDGHTKVSIFCKIHGYFLQSPHKHLANGGCRKCGVIKRSTDRIKTTEWFIDKATKIHNGEFDYTESIYVKSKEPVKIRCKNDHIFWQSPNVHLAGHKCPFCQKIGKPYWKILPKITFNEFIERSKIAHGDQYDYSKTKETFIEGNVNKKVIITCKLHGDFWQQTRTHMNGYCGCKRCHKKWRAEHRLLDEIRKQFPDIHVLHQYTPEWLGRQVFDIYIPVYNIAIEYNGQQHYHPVNIFGGIKSLIGQTEMDNKKRKACLDNDCKLFEIPYFFTTTQVHEEIEKIKNTIHEKNQKI